MDSVLSNGIYWIKYAAGRGKFSAPVLRYCHANVRLWHSETAASVPVELGEPLKRRPTKPGWYVVDQDGWNPEPVLLVKAEELGMMMLREPRLDAWGVHFNIARPLQWIEGRWKATWYGPFSLPKEDGDAGGA